MAQRLAQGWRASPSTLQRLTTQLTQALQDLSQATGGPIAHGAITTDNIILRQTPEGLQACLTNFSFAEQLLRDSDPSPPAATPSAPIQQTTADRMASHAAASSSSGSWDVEVEVASEPDMSAVHARSSSSSAAADAEVVMGGLSEALATEVGFAAPEALAGEPRMGVSDAYSMGAVLAAAAAGSSGTEQAAAGRGVPPSGLQGTRLAAVMQGLLQPDWQRRLTADQALRVLAGQPMPAMPAPQAPRLAGTGFQVRTVPALPCPMPISPGRRIPPLWLHSSDSAAILSCSTIWQCQAQNNHLRNDCSWPGNPGWQVSAFLHLHHNAGSCPVGMARFMTWLTSFCPIRGFSHLACLGMHRI